MDDLSLRREQVAVPLPPQREARVLPFLQTMRLPCRISMGHPERANKGEPRDLARAKKVRARDEYTKRSLQNVTLRALECNAFA